MSDIVVYVAGPYTNPDPVENTHKTIKAADELMGYGLVPVVPHLTLLWHLVSPKPYQEWLDLDLALMRRCDAVLRLEGASSGADGEVAEARRARIPVFYKVNDLLSWISEQEPQA